ncbi:PAS domain-containing protein [Fimbriiglobus ruber]|uniref:histidine kinase n=1 Tax=Fimbriiglobus ruber TaxID=1908690 RepID=A0A225D7C1_9BACT|nr:PAS domain-containing protein [Fimbriiglobus ruber]OWK34448.1 Chemotaxis protein methyltransferase CheR [Fimbriiglobus ruber]
MSQGFDRSVVVGLGLLAVLVVMNAAISHHNTRKLREDAARVAHSREILDVLSGLRADARKLQVSQRGFLISGDESRLRSFNETVDAIHAQIGRLKVLTADDPEQTRRIEELEAGLQHGIAWLVQMAGARRAKGLEAVRQLALAGNGQNVLDRLWDLAEEIDGEERRLLTARAEETDRAYSNAVQFGAASALFGLLAVGAFAWFLRRNMIDRDRAAEVVREQRELLQATLVSIGDGVIATDAGGRIVFLNAVAEKLTGWAQTEAREQPLESVFRIVDEATRKAADNPAARALNEGKIVGLANHTILIARDGTEWPLDDSAAPIRDARGGVAGAVLVFREITEKKQAEQALREQEQRAIGILESITDGFFAIDRQWQFSYVNRQAERLLDRAPDDLLGKNLWETYPGLVGSEFERAYRRAADDRVPGTVTAFYPDHDRWYEVQVYPAPDGISIYFRDVTTRQRADAALARVTAESERRKRLYETALSNTPDLVYVFDLNHRFTYANEALLRLWGRTWDEAIGKTCLELGYEPWHAAMHNREIDEVATTKRPIRGEVPFTGTLGRRIYDYIFVPVFGENGEVEAVAGTTRDVTERKEAEETIRRNEVFLRQLFEGSLDCIKVFDLDGRLLSMNEQGMRELEITDFDAVRGSDWCGFWQGETRETVARAIAEARSGGVTRFEGVSATRTGKLRWWHVVVTPIGPSEDRPERILAVSRDITDRKQVEVALREADRRKDEFLALLAHELRNPLAPLRNGLQVMRLAADDAAGVARVRAMMDRQLGHMVRLIDDLLDISRINRNKLHLQLSRVSLADVVGAAVETARPAIDAAGHEFAISLPAEPLYLEADLTRLAQVFANLLTNSAKYTERGGRITLAAEVCGAQVVVSVRDTGIGIPAEALPTIFDMFSQVDRSIERTTGGLGIGLALVKGLVEMHGGTVTAESGGSGKGTVFTVHLPVAARGPDPVSNGGNVETESSAGMVKRRVLVVDDNRDSATSMALMLELMGNEVRTAHDGLEAVDRAGEFRPDVVLMDVGMPRLNGLDATRRIREQSWGQTMTVIALTGWGQETDRQRSAEAGCNGHLVKPVSVPDLEAMLGSVPPNGPAT